MNNIAYLNIIQKSWYKNGSFNANKHLYFELRDTFDHFQIKVEDVLGLLEVLGNPNRQEMVKDLLTILNNMVSNLSTMEATVFDEIMRDCVKNKVPLYFDDDLIPTDMIRITFYRFV